MTEAATQEIQDREAPNEISPEGSDFGTMQASFHTFLSAVYPELMFALSAPTTEDLDRLLGKIRSFAARWPEAPSDSQAFLTGQLFALAEVCEMARHEKVPKNAAGVLIRRRDAEQIIAILAAQGSLTLTELAKRLEKASQNLHTTLREMTSAALIRRDEIGSTALYSATLLGRAALKWSHEDSELESSEKHKAAMLAQRLSRNISRQFGIREQKAERICGSVVRAVRIEVERKGAVALPGGAVICKVQKNADGRWITSRCPSVGDMVIVSDKDIRSAGRADRISQHSIEAPKWEDATMQRVRE